MEKRVLVVDDDEIFRKAMETLFKRAGYTVLGAASGEDALALLQTQPVSAMFLDLFLPQMDGIELCRRIRQQFPKATIYAVTGHAVRYDLEDCRKAGFDRCLMKPVATRELLDAAASAFAAEPG